MKIRDGRGKVLRLVLVVLLLNDHFIFDGVGNPNGKFARGVFVGVIVEFFFTLAPDLHLNARKREGSLVENSSGNQKGRNLALVLAGAGAFLCGGWRRRCSRDLRRGGRRRRNRLLIRGKARQNEAGEEKCCRQ